MITLKIEKMVEVMDLYSIDYYKKHIKELVLIDELDIKSIYLRKIDYNIVCYLEFEKKENLYKTVARIQNTLGGKNTYVPIFYYIVNRQAYDDKIIELIDPYKVVKEINESNAMDKYNKKSVITEQNLPYIITIIGIVIMVSSLCFSVAILLSN